MGKKGNWFSALKRAFITSSKDNASYGSDKNYAKEKKKWGLGKTKDGEVNSIIPLYREPSSIEKILGDAEREQYHRIHQDTPKKVQHLQDVEREQHHTIIQDPPKKFQNFRPPNEEPFRQVQRFKAPKPKQAFADRRAIDTSYAQTSAIKIQAAFRGYMARKNHRALKGLLRLQRVMRGQSVKRQTANTMKCMQLLVRVQSQVRARRLQMIESRNLQQQHQTPARSEKEMENTFSKWSLAPQSDAVDDGEWDDSVLTKEEQNTRMQRKVEAVIKRERALAYAYSHQLLKVTPKSAHAVLSDIRSGGSPWWWNWLDRQLPHEDHPVTRPKTPAALTPAFAKLRPSSHGQQMIDIFDPPTPPTSKAPPSPRANKLSLNTSNRWQQNQSRDDDSLTSCPAFRPLPNYMVPTVSAKAKVRDSQATGGRDGRDGEKKRFSFSLTQSIGSLRWGKRPLFASKDHVPAHGMSKGKHRSTNSIGGQSVDSTVSLPVGVGRKPFK